MLLENEFYYFAGLFFLALSRAKFILRGYSTPKPIDISETDKCIDYDISVVGKWLAHLKSLTHSDNYIAGKNILELGPGSDLGVGIYLLSMGAAQYSACDVNNLEKSTPDRFYEAFFAKLKNVGGGGVLQESMTLKIS